MTCACEGFPKPFRLHVPNTFPEDVAIDAIAPIAYPGGYEAVAVGPESDFDQYFLYPEGRVLQDASTPLLVATQTARFASQVQAVKVGIRAPYYGLLSGPIRLASHMSQISGGLTTAGQRRSMTGVDSSRKGTVDLLFYPKRPPNLPLMRPDRRHVGRWTFGTADATETTILTAPGFGSREQLFSSRRISGAVAYVSGTFAMKVYGEQFIGRLSGTDFFASTLLQTFTVTSNVFTSNYEYEGRFDYYRVTATETSLSGPDGIFEVQLLQRDN